VLVELRARDLGVIADLTLVLGPGMTAITGETGAGKTLVVEAIDLLVGGRADADAVRAGAVEAVVEGRFVVERGTVDTVDTADAVERVVRRTVPGKGRSRAHIDGAMATASELAELGRSLVDLHGQHAHQSLLHPATQRAALDAFGAVDTSKLVAARRRLAELDAVLAELGGDERARAREIDLLRHQVAELAAAAVTGPDEDAALAAEEDRLGDAEAAREAAAAAYGALSDELGAADAVGLAIAAVHGRVALEPVEQRLRALGAELADVAGELRDLAETLEGDPARLAVIRERRQLLVALRRKYGATLAEVIEFAAEAATRLGHLEQLEVRAASLDAEREVAVAGVAKAAEAVRRQRQKAAPRLAADVQARLRELAMAKAGVAVEVDGDDGAEVTILLAANPGEPAAPLAKAASGGELARAMLALRLVLSSVGSAPAGRPAAVPTLVFDEVDAGIGGEAALAVGRSLAALGCSHQVLVVTHLPQVAAFADQQVVVEKHEAGGRTISTAVVAEGEDRVRELARMLSGHPDAAPARAHAEELLRAANLAARREGAA
jgi:DNA repair protein RecN (Recombination protein N)